MIGKYSHTQGYSDLIAFQWFLNLTINKKLETYWIDRKKNLSPMRKQF